MSVFVDVDNSRVLIDPYCKQANIDPYSIMIIYDKTHGTTPYFFSFLDRTQTDHIEYDHFGVLFYSDTGDERHMDLAKLITHPYIVARNSDGDYPVTVENFWDDLDRWNAYLFATIKLDTETAQDVINIAKLT